MTLLWLQFIVSASAIVGAGALVARYGAELSERTRLGGLWIGTILVAFVTSLPEAVATVSSGVLELPDIAVGNVFGSNVFNILIIAVADFFDGRGSILRKVVPSHILVAVLGMLLSAVAAMAVLLRIPAAAGGAGLDTLLIGAVYLYGAFLLFRFERRPEGERLQMGKGPSEAAPVVAESNAPTTERPLAWLCLGFAASALVVVAGGLSLALSADALAEATGLGHTFVGSILVAAATSMPELATTVAAARQGAFDIAVGNVLGSNTFNMLILLLSDIAYRPGPILSAVSQTHAVVSLLGLIMSSIVIIGVFYRSKRSFAHLGPDSIFIIAVYLIGTYILYTLR